MSAFKCMFFEEHSAATTSILDDDGNPIQDFSVEAGTVEEARQKAKSQLAKKFPRRDINKILAYPRYTLLVHPETQTTETS